MTDHPRRSQVPLIPLISSLRLEPEVRTWVLRGGDDSRKEKYELLIEAVKSFIMGEGVEVSVSNPIDDPRSLLAVNSGILSPGINPGDAISLGIIATEQNHDGFRKLILYERSEDNVFA
jgi:hypothetical protein